MTPPKHLLSLTLVILGFFLGASALQAIAAWSAPVSSPPTCTSGNPGCDAPLNTSATAQVKNGPATFNFTNAATVGLKILGKFQMVDGTQGAGKVLTSDADGIGTWQTPTEGGESSGTSKYVISGDVVMSGAGNELDLSFGKGNMKYTLSGGGIISKLSLSYHQTSGSHPSIITTRPTPLACRYGDGSYAFSVTLYLNGVDFYTSPNSDSAATTFVTLNKSFADGDVLTIKSDGYCYAEDWKRVHGPFALYITEGNFNRIESISNAATYSYNTFTPSGTNSIAAAIETSGNGAGAVSGQLTLDTSKTYKVTYTYAPTSGVAPNIRFVTTTNGRSFVVGLDHLAVAGTNSVTFTPTQSVGYLEISVGNGSMTNFSMSNITLKLQE